MGAIWADSGFHRLGVHDATHGGIGAVLKRDRDGGWRDLRGHRLIISGLARAKVGSPAALRLAVAGDLSSTSTQKLLNP